MKFESKIYEDGVYEEASIYDAWLKNSNERNLFKKYLENKLEKWATKSLLSIIDIGCGSGAAGLRIMEILRNAGFEYEYSGLEPYRDQVKAFQKKLGDISHTQFILSGIQEFQANQKYDLAFAVHSLYYVPNMLEAIKKISTFSERAVIVHHGPRGINEVHENFREYVKQGTHIISTYNDVLASLKKVGIEFEFDTFPSEVNVQFIKESGNETGKKLIQFFLERTDLSDDVIEKVRNYFREKPDIMIHDVGIFITNPIQGVDKNARG